MEGVAILVSNVLAIDCTGGSNMRLRPSALTLITPAALAVSLGCLEPQRGNDLEHARQEVPGPSAKPAPDPDFHPE